MTSKVISIVELHYHPEVLRNTFLLLNGAGYKIKVFTTKDIWNKTNITGEKFQNLIAIALKNNKHENANQYLKKHRESINACDVVILNTAISDHDDYCKYITNPITIIRIHNSNFWFKYNSLEQYRPSLNAVQLKRDLSYFVRIIFGRNFFRNKKRLIERTDYFAFPSQAILNYTIDNLDVLRQKCVNLPFWVDRTHVVPDDDFESQKLTFTVVGQVDDRRRDYAELVDAFKRAYDLSSNNQKSIRLVLLGQAKSMYANQVLKNLKNISPHLEIVYFSEFVSDEVFTHYMIHSDVIILPIRCNTRFNIFKEEYGKTKLSGNVNDIISYRKKAFLKNCYPIDNEIAQLAISYKNAEELAKLIRQTKKTSISEDSTPANPSELAELYKRTLDEIITKKKSN